MAGAHVGLVGLGMMGWPFGRNLTAAGFEVVARDSDLTRQAAFVEEFGGVAAESPAAFADTAVVVTMLPDDRTVRDVLLSWGLAAALPEGAVVVDMSSSNPDGTKETGAQLASLGVAFVDAPVSGGITKADSGTLTLMIGGDDEDAIARAQPVLDVLGERFFRTGPLGSGHAMKALNNFVGGATYALVVEALTVGQKYGLDPATMIDVMNASTGRSFNTEVVAKDHVLTGAYATGFALGLLAKDVGIAAKLAASADVDAPLLELASRRWAEAAGELGDSADHSEAHKAWWSGRLDRGAEVSV